MFSNPFPARRYRSNASHRRRQICIYSNSRYAEAITYTEGRAGIKAEPAEPEYEHSQRCQRYVMAGQDIGFAVNAVFPFSRFQDRGSDKSRNATDSMYYS